MIQFRFVRKKNVLVFIFLFLASSLHSKLFSQPVVGLDNWFNHEVNASGKAFHYLWTDTDFSGYSEWGKIFISKGASLATVAKPVTSALKKINIYIIVDPDTTKENPSPNYIMDDDIVAVRAWVKNGGVLAVLANDAPNCEFTHLNRLMKEFGMKFNHTTLHTVNGDNFEEGASINLPDNPLFKGVSKIYLKDISDINLSGKAKAILTENGKVLIAENHFGKGYVLAIGDPWIYNEYIDHARLPGSFENKKAAENLATLLLSFIRK